MEAKEHLIYIFTAAEYSMNNALLQHGHTQAFSRHDMPKQTPETTTTTTTEKHCIIMQYG